MSAVVSATSFRTDSRATRVAAAASRHAFARSLPRRTALCSSLSFDKHYLLQELKGAVIGHAKDGSGKQSPGVVREAMLKKVLQALHSPLG